MIALRDAALLAQGAYKPPFTFQVEDICFNVGHYGDDTAVVFQGTEDMLEALRDLRALTTGYPGLGRLHNGVLKAALMAFPLFADLKPTAFIGHSLGGGEAIAACAIYALAFPKAEIRQLLAFEPLKIACDDWLGNLLNPRVTEQVLTSQGNDPVTRLPPTNAIFPYRHHTPLRNIGHDFLLPTDAHLIANVIAAL